MPHEFSRHIVTAGILTCAAVTVLMPEYVLLSVALNALVNIIWVWS